MSVVEKQASTIESALDHLTKEAAGLGTWPYRRDYSRAGKRAAYMVSYDISTSLGLIF